MPSDPLLPQYTSQDFLRLAQQATGKRQRMLLSLTQLKMLDEQGTNLTNDQRNTLAAVIADLQAVLPEKRQSK